MFKSLRNRFATKSESLPVVPLKADPELELTIRVPSDLFYPILLSFDCKSSDLVFLWTTCREVSRDFKNAIERVFMYRHLEETSLNACQEGDNGTSPFFCHCSMLF